MGVNGRQARERSGYARSRLAVQVYINSGWSEMTTTHKNVNEDIRDQGDVRKNTHTQTEDPEEAWAVRTRPGQCSIEGRKTMKPTDVVLLAAFFWAAHQAAGVKTGAE